VNVTGTYPVTQQNGGACDAPQKSDRTAEEIPSRQLRPRLPRGGASGIPRSFRRNDVRPAVKGQLANIDRYAVEHRHRATEERIDQKGPDGPFFLSLDWT